MLHLVINVIESALDFYKFYARAFNELLLVGVIAELTANTILRRQKIPRRTRRIFLWIYLIFCNFVYGYTISIRNHVEFNYSVGIATFLLGGLFIAILWHPNGDDGLPPCDNSASSRFVLWLDNKVREHKARKSERNPYMGQPNLHNEDDIVEPDVYNANEPTTAVDPTAGEWGTDD